MKKQLTSINDTCPGDPNWVEPLSSGEYLDADGNENWCHECGHRSVVPHFPFLKCGACGNVLEMVPKLKATD